MKIGILGGTFDPPHLGHLEFARAAIEQLGLDEVIFLPAHRNPLKKLKSSPAKQRLEMVRQMIASEPQMAISDADISRGGPSYMIETLQEFQMVRPADYWVLMGADAFKSFGEWKNPEKILKLCKLGVAVRPPATENEVLQRLNPELRDRIDIVPMKRLDISATDLRQRLAKGQGSLGPYMSPVVLQYIKQNHLYGS